MCHRYFRSIAGWVSITPSCHDVLTVFFQAGWVFETEGRENQVCLKSITYVSRKKKKSSSSTDARELKATHRTSDDKMSGKDPASYSMQRARTKAEQKFEEVQRKRVCIMNDVK